jgi:hypothetical protein
MPKPDEFKTVKANVTVADANIGSAIPQNMNRYIYRVKFLNQFAGPNKFTLGKREDGAVVTTNIDDFQTVLQYDTEVDPDELKEDMLPLYNVGGKITGDSYVRAFTDAGNGVVTLWYVDAPAQ